MANRYLIRKAAFHYSDDHSYFHMMGAIVGNIFDDYQEAHNSLMLLEKEMYLATDLGDIEPFSGRSNNTNAYKMVQLKHYFEKEFGLDVLKFKEGYGGLYLEDDSFLPAIVTNEQIDRIRSMSGLQFYQLLTFSDDVKFYGIWQKEPFFEEEGFTNIYGNFYFYNTYLEAYNAAIKYCPYHGSNKIEIQGTIEEIAEIPSVFKTIIKLFSNHINYDEKTATLSINQNMPDELWASLSTLLKDKFFEIRLLDFEEVKEFDNHAYEGM